MADTGFPGQHSTTTTVTSNTTVQTNIRFDPLYIRTIPGIIKIVQIVLNLLGFICIQVHSATSRGEFFDFVSMTGFWFTGVLLAFYLFHIIEKFYRIPWMKIEFVFCAVWVLLYLIAASLCAALNVIEAYSVAAFFGFCAMVAYGYDAFLKYKGVQSGELAQGERVITKQTTTASNVNTPTY